MKIDALKATPSRIILKSGTFKGVALTSGSGLEATFDSKEGRIAPVILLTHNIDNIASKWLSGSGAPAASVGNDGDYYLNSGNGDVYTKSSGAWSVAANISGPAGTSSWVDGSGTVSTTRRVAIGTTPTSDAFAVGGTVAISGSVACFIRSLPGAPAPPFSHRSPCAR